MKKIWIMLLLSSSVNHLRAQINLIPNFDFEQRDSCPDGPDEIDYCSGWHKFSQSVSTPDYYNSCAPLGYFNVPNAAAGYQLDHRNCNAFAGVVTFAVVTNDREHIGIQLSQSLVIGQKYFLSLYAVMAELVDPNGYRDGIPSNNIGMRLSTVAYDPTTPCPIDNFAHLYSTNIINDSINWNRIAGSIVADSAYNYIIIGNFFDDSHTDTLHYSCDSCYDDISYYYVDDVCLSTDSNLCNGGLDIIPCNVGFLEEAPKNEIDIYPNPVSDNLNVTFPANEYHELLFMDMLGNVIFRNNINFKKICTLNLFSISKGCYSLQLINKGNGKSYSKIIIKT